MERIAYLFDIDGVLTKPRQKMTDEFDEEFSKWIKEKQQIGHYVFLVSGSDLEKIQEQVLDMTYNFVDGIFCCMANEFYADGKQIYKNRIDIPCEMFDWLAKQVVNSEYLYPNRSHFPKYFEHRNGMLNFSICGRNCSGNERETYSKWDNDTRERQRIVYEFNQIFGDKYEAFLGGQISIDICEKGQDKSQAVKWLLDNERVNKFVFVGDKCLKSGNDYSICKEIEKHNGRWHQVDYGFQETLKLLKKL